MATFQNDKKKAWFLHKTRLVFVHGEVFKDRSRNFAIFNYLKWSSLQQLVTLAPKTNGQYLHIAALTGTSLLAKLKSDENGHALKAASDTFSCFLDMLLHFFRKCRLLSV